MTTQTEGTVHISTNHVPTGPAAAAILSGSIGVFVIGLLTTLSEASSSIGSLLNWYNPSGNLTGKTGVGIIVWLVSWVILNSQWKDKEIELKGIFTWTGILLVLGFLLTFPPFFDLFK